METAGRRRLFRLSVFPRFGISAIRYFGILAMWQE
jgi:hypothetical protein